MQTSGQQRGDGTWLELLTCAAAGPGRVSIRACRRAGRGSASLRAAPAVGPGGRRAPRGVARSPLGSWGGGAWWRGWGTGAERPAQGCLGSHRAPLLARGSRFLGAAPVEAGASCVPSGPDGAWSGRSLRPAPGRVCLHRPPVPLAQPQVWAGGTLEAKCSLMPEGQG